MANSDQKKRLPKAKIAIALQNELGRRVREVRRSTAPSDLYG